MQNLIFCEVKTLWIKQAYNAKVVVARGLLQCWQIFPTSLIFYYYFTGLKSHKTSFKTWEIWKISPPPTPTPFPRAITTTYKFKFFNQFQIKVQAALIAYSSVSNCRIGDCMSLSCQVRVSEWIYTLELTECQGTHSKQARCLKFNWQQRDSNPLSL